MIKANKNKTNIIKKIICNNNDSINYIKIKKRSNLIILFIILINHSFNQSNEIKQKYGELKLISNYSYPKKEFNSYRLLEENDKDKLLMELRHNISLNLIQEGTIIQSENIIYEITSTEKEKYKENNNISRIFLGICENIIRAYYHFAEEVKFIINKYEYYEEGMSTPIIEYEIFNSINNEKLSLSICNKNPITILVPAYEISISTM